MGGMNEQHSGNKYLFVCWERKESDDDIANQPASVA